jgi:hypothetical protein
VVDSFASVTWDSAAAFIDTPKPATIAPPATTAAAFIDEKPAPAESFTLSNDLTASPTLATTSSTNWAALPAIVR